MGAHQILWMRPVRGGTCKGIGHKSIHGEQKQALCLKAHIQGCDGLSTGLLLFPMYALVPYALMGSALACWRKGPRLHGASPWGGQLLPRTLEAVPWQDRTLEAVP